MPGQETFLLHTAKEISFFSLQLPSYIKNALGLIVQRLFRRRPSEGHSIPSSCQ